MKIAILQAACVALMAAFALTACNMPTPPSQITGAYTSGLNYKGLECEEMAAEETSLARRENMLVLAQEQRIKTSEIQAFWLGFGDGDGVEAAELAHVRGQREALRRALESKPDC